MSNERQDKIDEVYEDVWALIDEASVHHLKLLEIGEKLKELVSSVEPKAEAKLEIGRAACQHPRDKISGYLSADQPYFKTYQCTLCGEKLTERQIVGRL